MAHKDRSGLIFSGVVTAVVFGPVLWLAWPRPEAEELESPLQGLRGALPPELGEATAHQDALQKRCGIAFQLPTDSKPDLLGEFAIGIPGTSGDPLDGVGIDCFDGLLGTDEAIDKYFASRMKHGRYRAAGPPRRREHDGYPLIDQHASTTDGVPARLALWVTPASAIIISGSSDSVRTDARGQSRFDAIVASLRYVGGEQRPFTVAEITQGDLAEQIKEQHVLAELAGRRHFILLSASWCPPCKVFMDGIDDPRFAKALTGIHLTVIDFDAFEAFAEKLGVSSVPTWLELDEEGRFTGRRLAGGWTDDTVEAMAPVLAEFLAKDR